MSPSRRVTALHHLVQRFACVATIILASAGASAQTVTIEAVATPVPVPSWLAPLLSVMLAAVVYAILRRRIPDALVRLRGLPLLAVVSVAAFAVTMSGDWVNRVYASACTNCSFNLTSIPETLGPVAWDTDVAVTNQTRPLDTGSVYVTCPSYTPCALVTPLTSPGVPQCAHGLALATGATCVLRVETHAGLALRSGGANKYVTAADNDGALSAIAAAPGPALGQFLLESNNSTVTVRSIGNGNYLAAHGDLFVFADAARSGAATAWVVFLVGNSNNESQAVILEDGPVSANVNVLQYDTGSQKLHVVSLPVATAFSDSNSQFYFSPAIN